MTSRLEAVQNELAQLKEMLARAGIGIPRPSLASDKDRADYIEFGSERHAVHLGLVKAEKGDGELYIVYEGQKGAYRLEDEITAYMHHHDPRQVARMTLRHKVKVLEAGKPSIPTSAPPLQTPGTHDGAIWTQVAREGVTA
ncbi:MAG: hypothetical protein GY832_26370 [Chloroflexi bacterium]|nr:hypothetical protein [Chloroflexota bacterium]